MIQWPATTRGTYVLTLTIQMKTARLDRPVPFYRNGQGVTDGT